MIFQLKWSCEPMSFHRFMVLLIFMVLNKCRKASNLNYYLSFDVCARFRLRLSASVCVCLRLSVCVCELFNGCIYQRMLVYKADTFLKRIKMAVLFLLFLNQICPKWIKLDQTWMIKFTFLQVDRSWIFGSTIWWHLLLDFWLDAAGVFHNALRNGFSGFSTFFPQLGFFVFFFSYATIGCPRSWSCN